MSQISRQKANEMVSNFKSKKMDLPDGYIFNADEVRNLLSNPDAENFMIQLGVNQDGELSTILCVADKDYNIIPGINSMQLTSGIEGDDDGGFLDEAIPYPPFPK